MRNVTLLFLSMLMLVSTVCGVVMADEPTEPAFGITFRGRGDTATILEKTDRVVFHIRSSTGIGGATITRRGPAWPASVVVRLHVNGLESFQVSNEETDEVSRKLSCKALTLHAAIASHPGVPSIRRWRNDDEHELLDQDSQYWMPIQLLDPAGHLATQMPLRGGDIELRLPAILFADNPREITLRWIDFYRG